MAKIIVYSKVPCPYCVSAKRFLENRGLEFQEIDLTDHPDEMIKMKQKWGWSTFPIIIINDQCIGGYQDMKALEEDGKLESLLK
jgi:glutaredoxin 3